jgi:4-aminobutyrate aminotransferase-like enzyme
VGWEWIAAAPSSFVFIETSAESKISLQTNFQEETALPSPPKDRTSPGRRFPVGTLDVRRSNYGPNATLSYTVPLNIVRGEGTYLYDDQGQKYLDCCNNVAHVGHCHQKVTAAVSRQLSTINTNARYLHNTMGQYTKALLSTFPPQLEVCICP